jgi:hypothetical protein
LKKHLRKSEIKELHKAKVEPQGQQHQSTIKQVKYLVNMMIQNHKENKAESKIVFKIFNLHSFWVKRAKVTLKVTYQPQEKDERIMQIQIH